MDCMKFIDMLDAFIDGELDAGVRAQILAHADACEACAKELKKAQALSDILKGLDSDMVAPISAQAAWRKAIRNEKNRRVSGSFMRIGGALAAAFVIMLGVTFAFKPANTADNANLAPARAMLQIDGELHEPASDMAEPMRSETEGGHVFSVAREITTDGFDASLANIQDLVSEYGGSYQADESALIDGARVMHIDITIPAPELMAFLDALNYTGSGAEQDNTSYANAEAGEARVMITLRETVAAEHKTEAKGGGIARFFSDMGASLIVIAPYAAIVLGVAAAVFICVALVKKRRK